jgi:PAT family beta-lactamase induction signal transducer AmpG
MARRDAHPWVFMVLGMPFGLMSGYLTVTIAWQLAQAGIGVGPISALIAASFIPHTTKFLWAPFIDTTLDNRRWYLLTGLLSAVGVAAIGLVPPTERNLGLLTTVVVVSNFAVAVVGMTTQALMLTSVPPEKFGRAGGWFQAGNLGGGGLGGGLGLILAERLKDHPAVPGIVLAALCAVCIAPLWMVHEPREHRPLANVGPALVGVVKDIWHLARSKPGALALLLSLLPIGSGAASGLWSAVASDWHASANTVALATGVLSGVIMMVGSIAGGWACDRMDRKNAYMLFGVMQALCAIGMALLPHTERWYFVMTSLYSFVTGLTYAGYSAFVLEAMGAGAAATKFSLYASLSNTPIMYMTRVDGWAHGRFGPSGMLFGEAIAGAIGLAFFLLARESVRRGLLGTSRLRERV